VKPQMNLRVGITPKGVEERLCSKCKVRPRRVGVSWCTVCEAEAKKERRRKST
jgi:hypothetical protein